MPAIGAFLVNLSRMFVPYLISNLIARIITSFGIFFFSLSFVNDLISIYLQRFFDTLQSGSSNSLVSNFMVIAHLMGVDKAISITVGAITALIAIKSMKKMVGMS